MVAEGRPGDDRAQLILPQLRMDDLLNELQARLQAVVSTRDRVHSLLEAVVSIGSDLDLETVLRRIIEAATRLVDARRVGAADCGTWPAGPWHTAARSRSRPVGVAAPF